MLKRRGNQLLSIAALGFGALVFILAGYFLFQLVHGIVESRKKIVVSEEVIGSELGTEDCLKNDLCMICEVDFEDGYVCRFKLSSRCPGSRAAEFDVYRRTFYYKKSPDSLLTEEFRVVKTVIDKVCR